MKEKEIINIILLGENVNTELKTANNETLTLRITFHLLQVYIIEK